MTKVKDLLDRPGVYILYREEEPYCIGRTNHLFRGLWRHAMNPRVRQFHFWTHFWAHVVSEKRYLDAVEGILITATPPILAYATGVFHQQWGNPC